MNALLLQIIPLIVSNVPILVDKVKEIINTAHQNSELSDAEHAALMAAFVQTAQTDPAWKPSPDYVPPGVS
jgi:hypothetical protein